MGLNYIQFGNVRSSDFGIYISGEGTFNAPVRKGSVVSVPGRNGDLFIDGGAFENIEVTYPAYFYEPTLQDFSTTINNFRNAMLGQKGYQTLTDTFNTGEYRKGLFVAGLEVSPVMYNTAATFDLVFNCKPQRFLTSGQTYYTVPADTDYTFTNPTPFDSFPYMELNSGYYGATITINGVAITIAATNSSRTLSIDTATGDAYLFYNGQNMNQYISIPGNEFPRFVPGENTVRFTKGSASSSTTLNIRPNWWRI